jgi:hypothetical protein
LLTVCFLPALSPGEPVMSMTVTVKVATNNAVFDFMARPLLNSYSIFLYYSLYCKQIIVCFLLKLQALQVIFKGGQW